MDTFTKDMAELTVEEQKLVLTFLQDMRISYDPEWITVTNEEAKELQQIEEQGEFISLDEAIKELGL
ncbi:hypothetical protein HKO22_02965 [Peptoniphilus sp. AGMB00490]|uniref:Addiction module component n=1 Tax=Peptoniphilus faecalis TaxID=2731255 RepID=A0A848RFB9_9FIRM|nr:hypothetical protein [Peptoniphilus faecalis]NMW84705.1 hypothetical protein [Peptoniphilus faecalis]